MMALLWNFCFFFVLLCGAGVGEPQHDVIVNSHNESPGTHAYFYVAEGSKKCFFENTPANLPVTVTYSSAENPGVSCTLSVADPRGRQVDNKEVTAENPRGRITHLTRAVGQHSICVACPSSKWFGTSMIKWTLSVDLGDTEINLAAAAKGSTLQSNERLIRVVSQRLNYLYVENRYHEEQETALHVSTDALGNRVVFCSLLQVVMISLSTVLAVMHLTRHFRAEKLVS